MLSAFKQDLYHKLNQPGLRVQHHDMTSDSNAVPITLKEIICRNRKIGVVEEIKNFCPELHLSF